MIIIIRTLPHRGKDDGDYGSPISRDETPDEKIKKYNKRERPKKEKAQKKEKNNNKMREKERRGNVTILLPHLCFKVAPCYS